jgi:hypothetical protein
VAKRGIVPFKKGTDANILPSLAPPPPKRLRRPLKCFKVEGENSIQQHHNRGPFRICILVIILKLK